MAKLHNISIKKLHSLWFFQYEWNTFAASSMKSTCVTRRAITGWSSDAVGASSSMLTRSRITWISQFTSHTLCMTATKTSEPTRQILTDTCRLHNITHHSSPHLIFLWLMHQIIQMQYLHTGAHLRFPKGAEPIMGVLGWNLQRGPEAVKGQSPLKLKAFCPFSYKRGKNTQMHKDLSVSLPLSEADCFRQPWEPKFWSMGWPRGPPLLSQRNPSKWTDIIKH